MMPEGRPRTVAAVKLGLGIAMIAAALWVIDWRAVVDILKSVDPWVFAGAVALIALEFPILGLRWHLMVREVAPQPLGRHMRGYLIATFVGSFTPGQVGGDIYRFLDLGKAADSKASLAAVILQERVIGLATFLLFYLACMGGLLLRDTEALGGARDLLVTLGAASLAGLLGLACAGPLLGWARSLPVVAERPALAGMAEFVAAAVRLGPARRLVPLLALSLLGGCGLWALAVAILAGQAGAAGVPWLFLGMVAVAVELIRLVPLTAQGLGVRELAFAALFAAAGHGAEAGFALGAVAYAAASLSLVLAGAAGAAMPKAATLPSSAG